MLHTLIYLLVATVLAVPLARRLGLGSILGYLVAGICIGPAVLGLVTDVEQIAEVAELGVVMLLFLIGIELRPHRLWVLRRAVFGLGLAQMVPSAAIIAALAWAAGVPWGGALTLGAGLALSSTAIVLPMLSERGLLPSAAGRDVFAVVLFQDMAFIPLVALIPLLGNGHMPEHVPWESVARGLVAVVVILVGGSLLTRPLFRVVSVARSREVFTATALLLVLGTAGLAAWAGLSMSLGAFMAGVLLSDSEYRHELQADIEPFKGLLLGFFFISVGMSANLWLAAHHPVAIAVAVVALFAAKITVAFAVGMVKRRAARVALRFALALPEGSEFAFVLFAAAVSAGVLSQDQADLAILVVALSMLVTPALFAASERWFQAPAPARPDDFDKEVEGASAPVIICGFGRMGQVVGRILRMQRIPFTALDTDAAQVAAMRRFGLRAYLGDPTREEVLRAAGAAEARVLVVALDDLDATVAVVTTAQRHFPHLAIVARVRNRMEAHRLMDFGIRGIVRETFHSSLYLSELVLGALDVPPDRARRALALFREHDERNLAATLDFAGDEERLARDARQAASELTDLFEADQEAEPGATS
jgi:CPA2 family monovalent cation:H+ antiporter-2/glutathione-regulated potassium-efflux system protein KefB